MKGAWKTALVDIDRPSEFTGDDVDQFSKLVDLGKGFKDLLVLIPTLTSSVVSVYVQKGGGKDEVPVSLVILDDDATGHFAHATTAGVGDIAVVFHIGGAQFVRIRCGSNQAADRSFSVMGSD